MSLTLGVGLRVGKQRRRRGSGGFVFDPDAWDYIQRVEAADGDSLEPEVRLLIDEFVLGYKSDTSPRPGVLNWDAAKTLYILNIARTLSGALEPLKGGTPVNQNFAESDYTRGLGLRGNGVDKRLLLPRKINEDPQDNKHLAAFTTVPGSGGVVRCLVGGIGNTHLLLSQSRLLYPRIHFPTGSLVGAAYTVGFVGASRAINTTVQWVLGDLSGEELVTSQNPTDANSYAFSRNDAYFDGTLSYVSDGESVDLLSVRDRVKTLNTGIQSFFA